MEVTTTLADALLDDLDDLSEDHHHHPDDEHDDANRAYTAKNNNNNHNNNNNAGDDGDAVMNETENIYDSHATSRKNEKKLLLLDDPKFMRHIQTIQQQLQQQQQNDDETTANDTNDTNGIGNDGGTGIDSSRNSKNTEVTTKKTKNEDDEMSTQPLSSSPQDVVVTNAIVNRSSSRSYHNNNSSNNKNKNSNNSNMDTTTTSTGTTNHQQAILLLQTNYYLEQIKDEIQIQYHDIVHLYQYKFPQLDTIITNIQQYTTVVAILDNYTDITMKRINDALNQYLSSQQIITISIAYSTCNGRLLSSTEVLKLHQHVQYIQQLFQYQQNVLLRYIEQQMIGTVPNMVAYLNSSALVAQLLSQVHEGSLEQLVKIPACNLQLLGQQRSTNSHTTSSSRTTTLTTTGNWNQPQSQRLPQAAAVGMNHTGILLSCDLVQSVPKVLQRKVLKIVASKLALVIRCDYNHQQRHQTLHTNNNTSINSTNAAIHNNSNNMEGIMFRQQVQKKIEQLLEPERAPTLKALPKPDLTVKKRRGGQRMRRLKGRYEETALMKQANTRAFSMQTGEYGDDAMGRTLGLLEMSTGSVGTASASNEHSSIRSKNHIEQKKMKYANTRASRKRAAQMNRQGLAVGGGTAATSSLNSVGSSGMASSMVFTPVQGMELINPDAMKDRVKEANRKWFSSNAGFQSAVPPK